MSRIIRLCNRCLSIMVMLTTWSVVVNFARAAQDRPNILMILADDLGFEDTSCYGSEQVHTPNIDQLARDGMRFTRAFTPTAMCAPSRSTLYTGLYPIRHGCYRNHGRIREGIKTLPQYLQPLGYRVGLAGKAHIKPRAAFPFEMYGFAPGPDAPLDMDAIEQFITRDRDQPFCLVIATHEPHTPFPPPEHFNPATITLPPYLVDTPQTRTERAGYFDLILRLDAYVGQIRDILERAHQLDNTLVIFTSDHGAGFPFEKWTCYEAGLKVPFIVRWPGHIAANSQSNAMISFVDVLPTMIDAAGGDPPAEIDGASILPVLLGKKTVHHDVIFGIHTTRGIIQGSLYPVRSVRDDRYKLIRNLYPEGEFRNIITNGERKTLWDAWVEAAKADPFAAQRVREYQHRPAEELYDLDHDPYELHNLIDDPAYANARATLSGRLDRWMATQDDDGVEAERAIGNQRETNQ